MIKEENKNNFFIYMLLFSIITVVISSFYIFYIKNDYNFFIEVKCDSLNETCFFRDCENNKEICPPNNLSYYNQYIINAKDFEKCLHGDCFDACNSKIIKCLHIKCTDDDINNGICLNPLSTTFN